jgi:transketolase
MVKTIIAPDLVGQAGDSLREAFGKAITRLGEHYSSVVVLDGDVAGGTGAHHFRKRFPDRFIQCGIAEQNMMALAAGLESEGFIPVVTTFAVFCLRAFEQARLSIAYPRRNVKIIASHPGLDTGPDGASAQCLEDLAAFRAIPGMVVLSPCDAVEIEQATEAILEHKGPVYMRTGRSPVRRVLSSDYRFRLGHGQILRQGSDVTLVACGVEVARALDAADILSQRGVGARVVTMPTIKPIDAELLQSCARETGCIVTAEDHSIYGGLGGAVAEALAELAPVPIRFIGLRDTFGESGEPEELAQKYGLTGEAIAEAALNVIQKKDQQELLA